MKKIKTKYEQSAHETYLRQELKNDFKDWTKEGLEFLIKNKEVAEDIISKAEEVLNILNNKK